MPHKTPESINDIRTGSDAVRLSATLLALVVLVCFGVALAHAQGGRKPRTQTTPATAAQPQSRQRAKLTPLRSTDTAQGSQLTITSTEPLNNYSAYRSGNRFYVLIPNADAGAVGGGVRGRGFEDAQVQKRGDDVVLSFRVQPGAKPRVQQRFNKLDVVFAAEEGAQASTPVKEPEKPQTTETRSATPTATPQQNVQTATQNNPSQEIRNPSGLEPVTPTTPPQDNVVNAPQPTGTATSEYPQQAAPIETPAAAGQQVADARQPGGAGEPTKITADPAAAQPGTAFGATVLRNWPLALIGTLLLVGLGLFFAARRSSAAKQPMPASPPPIVEAKAPVLRQAGAYPVEPVRPAAPVTAAPTVVEQSKGIEAEKPEAEVALPSLLTPVAPAQDSARAAKKKKKGAKEKRGGVEDSAPFTPAIGAAEAGSYEATAETPFVPPVQGTPLQDVTLRDTTPSETAVEETLVYEPVAEETPALLVETPSIEGPAAETATVETAAATVAGEPAVEEGERAGEPVSFVEAPSAESAIELAAPVLDPDDVQAETRRLLEGEAYDHNLIAVSDAVTRQIIASELLSALAGRNAERKERARTAFVEHGYFNETAHDLHNAEAPAERASAARSLGLVGDRVATSHLIAALEDNSSEVRRAAVEALAAVRDPKAVEPLKALRERERMERVKLSRTLIQHAIDVCTEAPEVVAPTLATTSAASLVAPAETTQTAGPATIEAAPVEDTAIEAVAETRVDEIVAPSEEVRAPEPFAPEAEETPTLVTSGEVVSAQAHAPEVSAPSSVVEEREEALTGVEHFVPAVEETEVAHPAEESRAVEPVQPPPYVAAPPAQVLDIEALPHVEETAASEEAVADQKGIAPATKAVEGFKGTRAELPAEDWSDIDVHDAEVNYRKYEADVLEKLAPVEAVAIEEPRPATHGLVSEADAPPEITATHVPPPGRVERPAPPRHAAEVAGTSEGKGIAPFVEDDMSAVPKAIQVRLASGEPEERATAIKDLAHVSGDDAFQVICAGFDDPSPDVRSAAARSLYSLQEDHAEAFTRALREAGPQRRRQIGASIASSGLAGEALSHLTGESREKTYDAFSLLFLMAKAGEVQPLIKAIEAHPDNEVRLAVVKLLALSGQKEILPTFRRLAVRGSLPTDVRSAVMEAIYQISSQSTPVA